MKESTTLGPRLIPVACVCFLALSVAAFVDVSRSAWSVLSPDRSPATFGFEIAVTRNLMALNLALLLILAFMVTLCSGMLVWLRKDRVARTGEPSGQA
jgi:hypothetical protein